MCFSPKRRAIFRHQNFKKVLPDPQFFLTFWLQNVLFATAACNFSTSELQKVLRHRQFFSILTSKCAFHRSGVQFLISLLNTYLRTRRFNRPTFGLTRHTNHWKNTAFRDFSNIWRGCIFFLLTFALLHLLSADLTTLLCFSTVHIVGSLLFKLPSIIFVSLTLCFRHHLLLLQNQIANPPRTLWWKLRAGAGREESSDACRCAMAFHWPFAKSPWQQKCLTIQLFLHASEFLQTIFKLFLWVYCRIFFCIYVYIFIYTHI